MLGLNLLITLGIGLSWSEPAEQQTGQPVFFLWFCCPGFINLPGISYALFTQQRRFLAGWVVGFLASLLLLGGTLGCIALYIATLRNAY